jgi:hypothetical protein
MKPELHDVDARLSTHEAVCAERYAGINDAAQNQNNMNQ